MQKHEEEERRRKADETKKQKAELKQRRREEHARLQAEKKAQEEREREREQAEQGLYRCFTQSICHIDLSSFFFHRSRNGCEQRREEFSADLIPTML